MGTTGRWRCCAVVAGTRVRVGRPWLAALVTLLTGGVWGTFVHGRIVEETALVGRRRGAMPFAFVDANAVRAGLGWLLGLAVWWLLVALAWWWGAEVLDGRKEASSTTITAATSVLLALAPMWITAHHQGRNLRHLQLLTGADDGPGLCEPRRLAIAAVCCPPAYAWLAQRHANRAWQPWIGAAVEVGEAGRVAEAGT